MIRTSIRPSILVLALALSAPLPCLAAPDGAQPTDLWDDYWEAESLRKRSRQTKKLVDRGVSFEEAYAALTRGRPYRSDVPRGLERQAHVASGGLLHPWVVVVPESYDPTHPHKLIVYLHGGVQRPPAQRGETWWPRGFETADEGEILVVPVAWSESVWWQHSQVDNLDLILEKVRTRYNVDENRVHLMGVSDGGTGAWFQALRHPTPWASYLPFIGHSRVLGNPAVEPDGQMHAVNTAGQSFFVVSGGKDRLYPSWSVAPYLDLFSSAGARIEFRHHPEGGHDLRWWPEEEERIGEFIEETIRDPLPERLVWETEEPEVYGRNRWLLIDRLGSVPGEPEVPEFNQIQQPDGSGETLQAFPHPRASGRVEVERRGNTIVARTRGARSFRLLLSPEEIDFDQPLRIGVNGRELFHGPVAMDVTTLLYWASRDLDRTMLFGAELLVDVLEGTVEIVNH